jgi:hypothetical protein
MLTVLTPRTRIWSSGAGNLNGNASMWVFAVRRPETVSNTRASGQLRGQGVTHIK